MDVSETWTRLLGLVGRWEGTGRGFFPTLDDFDYREILNFSIDIDQSLLSYNQKTWRSADDGEVESHREAGFLGITAAGGIEMSGSHGVDRVEVLAGGMTPTEDGFILSLDSVVLGHDERMISSWRTLVLAADTLSYEMGMATTAVPEGAQHLHAGLKRKVWPR